MRIFYCLNDAEGKAVSVGNSSPEVAARTQTDVEGLTDVIEVYTSNFFIGLGLPTESKR